MLHQGFPLKQQKSLGLLVVKPNLPRPHALLVHSFSYSASTTHLEGMDGKLLHSAPSADSVGSFFPAIPSKLRFFPNRLRFANIYCSLFQGVIWWFFSMMCTHSPIKSLDLGWLRSLNHPLLAHLYFHKFLPGSLPSCMDEFTAMWSHDFGCALKRVTSSTRIHCKDLLINSFGVGSGRIPSSRLLEGILEKYSPPEPSTKPLDNWYFG